MLPKGITWALLPLPVPFPAGLILPLGLAVFPDLSPLCQVPFYISPARCVTAGTTRVGGKRSNSSLPLGQRAHAASLGWWDRQALIPAFSCLEPHLSHQPEQAQTCHITSTSGEGTVVPIPEAGAWGQKLVTECRNRAWGLLQV